MSHIKVTTQFPLVHYLSGMSFANIFVLNFVSFRQSVVDIFKSNLPIPLSWNLIYLHF